MATGIIDGRRWWRINRVHFHFRIGGIGNLWQRHFLLCERPPRSFLPTLLAVFQPRQRHRLGHPDQLLLVAAVKLPLPPRPGLLAWTLVSVGKRNRVIQELAIESKVAVAIAQHRRVVSAGRHHAIAVHHQVAQRMHRLGQRDIVLLVKVWVAFVAIQLTFIGLADVPDANGGAALSYSKSATPRNTNRQPIRISEHTGLASGQRLAMALTFKGCAVGNVILRLPAALISLPS